MEPSQNITLLTGANWESWKHMVKILLLVYGAWEFIEKPEEVYTNPPVYNSESETKEAASEVSDLT